MKLPKTFDGSNEEEMRKVYERIMSEKNELPKQDPLPNPITIPSNITGSDYVQIPGEKFVIAIGETDKGLDYNRANLAVMKRNLYVPTIKEFMAFHNHIIDSYKNGKTIFDANGNLLSDATREDLYKQLTSDCWTWLNAKFDISRKKKSIEYVTGFDNNDNLVTKKEDLESCLTQDGWVDFSKLSTQGIPTSTSSTQSYNKGEKIYFWHPIDGRVARFGASSGGAGLNCIRYPSDANSDLGVRAVRRL